MPVFDRDLLAATGILILLGLVMVASTTVNLAQQQWQAPLHLFWRQAAYTGAGLLLALFAALVPIRAWHKLSVGLLLLGLSLLLLVLIPGLGHEVNGSLRWIDLGPFNMQPSEPMKLAMIFYLAGYLVRRKAEVQAELSGSLKPLAVLMLITGLLLLEPDYGTAVVLFATVMGMLFLAGVPLRQFGLWVLGVSLALAGVVLLAPYRVERLATFMNPWADPFDRGFQLTQALIAIGRGEWFGVGLGSSVQKLAYLPEAHTDFLFAILAEELGLFGGALVIALFAFVVWRAFLIAQRARQQQSCYAAYLAYGIALYLALQSGVNLGVNMGLLPTKGLPLPFMSYGGSSMLINCIMIAVLLRVDYESRPQINAD